MVRIRHHMTLCAVAGVLGIPAGVAAQPMTIKSSCVNTTPFVVERSGAQAGPGIAERPYACVVSGGPLDGGALTGVNVWDVRGADWTLASGISVSRRADGYVVTQATEGKLTMQMKDGKVLGWSAAGGGRYTAAGGVAAPLAGKRFTWKASPTGPSSFTTETTVE
jgi:hypothetical protein